MSLDLLIILETQLIHAKFLANNWSNFINIQAYVHVKIHEHFLSEFLTFKCDLSWHNGKIGSAHCLVGMNICAKFEENPSIRGLIDWT